VPEKANSAIASWNSAGCEAERTTNSGSEEQMNGKGWVQPAEEGRQASRSKLAQSI
jgi:hypothetical protein